MIKIAIVEDKPQLLRTLKEALSMFEEVEVLFTARHGKEAIDKLVTLPTKPEVILMDIEMDVMDGIATTRQAKQYFPKVHIIMLTVFDQEDKIFDAILAGASGYMLKGEKPSRIVQAIEDAKEGRLPMSPLVARKTLALLKNQPKQPDLLALNDFELTAREVEILEFVAKGKTHTYIAEQLFISPKTVRNHIHNIYKKLQVNSKGEAINLALKNKWFEP